MLLWYYWIDVLNVKEVFVNFIDLLMLCLVKLVIKLLELLV